MDTKLHVDGLIQSKADADLLDVFGRGVVAGDDGRGVPGRDAHQQETNTTTTPMTGRVARILFST